MVEIIVWKIVSLYWAILNCLPFLVAFASCTAQKLGGQISKVQFIVSFCLSKLTQPAQWTINRCIRSSHVSMLLLFSDIYLFLTIQNSDCSFFANAVFGLSKSITLTKNTQLVSCKNPCWAICDVVLTRVHRLYQGFKIKVNQERRKPYRLITVENQDFVFVVRHFKCSSLKSETSSDMVLVNLFAWANVETVAADLTDGA